MKLLFICTGNTCRSVMGQFLSEKMGRDLGIPVEAKSCGVAAERYFKVPPGVHKALAGHGVTTFEHVAQLVSRDLLTWCDAALCLTRAHRDEVLDRFPEFRKKVFVLKEYAGAPGSPDVEDPIGQSDQVYSACCAEIKQALDALLRKEHEHPEKPRS